MPEHTKLPSSVKENMPDIHRLLLTRSKLKLRRFTLKSTDKYTVKASAVKKNSKTLKKAIKVTKKTGKVSYTTNNSKIKVNKNGKIVVAKGTKKGTYQVKVTVKAKKLQDSKQIYHRYS